MLFNKNNYFSNKNSNKGLSLVSVIITFNYRAIIYITYIINKKAQYLPKQQCSTDNTAVGPFILMVCKFPSKGTVKNGYFSEVENLTFLPDVIFPNW